MLLLLYATDWVITLSDMLEHRAILGLGLPLFVASSGVFPIMVFKTNPPHW